MDLNKAMLIGRLTRDPEVRTTPQGTTVCSFSIATNFMWNDQQGQKQKRVEYHNIVTWRKLAEICAQYLKKASKVYIEGRLQTREWQGQDGAKRQRTEIVADNMIMLDSASAQSGSFNISQNKPQQTQSANPPIQTIQVDQPAGSIQSNPPPSSTEPTVEPVTASVSEPSKPQEEASVPKKEGVSVEDIPF